MLQRFSFWQHAKAIAPLAVLPTLHLMRMTYGIASGVHMFYRSSAAAAAYTKPSLSSVSHKNHA